MDAATEHNLDTIALDEIKSAIPHREPFLLVDEVVEQADDRIVCRKTFTGDEFWYQGHYPGYPLTPGVLLCEAAMQASAMMLAKPAAEKPGHVPVATRLSNVQFKRMVRPGDTIQIEVDLIERLADAYFMKARILLDGKLACRCEFASTMAAPSD